MSWERLSDAQRITTVSAQGVRWFAAALYLVVTALAMATVARPPHGYSRAGPLVLAMVGGAAAGALALVCAAALVRVSARRRGHPSASLARTASSYPVLGLALAALTVAIVAVELWPQGPARTEDAALKASFSRWQRETVPRVLTYVSAVRSLVPATRPARVDGAVLRARVLRARAALRALGRALATESERYRRSPRLRAVTAIFQQAVRLASTAAADLGAALRARLSVRGASNPTARRIAQRLLHRAHAELRRSQQAMQLFTFQANGLGGRLSAGA